MCNNDYRATREQAKETFRGLVAVYGLQWRADVPLWAWQTIADCNAILTEQDRRDAIMGR